MIPINFSNDEQIFITEKGLERAHYYREQWEGKWVKRNYQTDREALNWPAFIAQQSEAVGAEVAVSKYFNQPVNWDGFKEKADVGRNIEVKWTKWKDGSLILRDHDPADHIAILVTGSLPKYFICGWIPIAVARRPSHKRSDGAWWIGQQDLHPMANFSRSIYANQI
ncbi:MAG: hypothetical protein EBV86_01720 [Marivivens sp.]|nr:hypothetical protein [Marivivens sp.]